METIHAPLLHILTDSFHSLFEASLRRLAVDEIYPGWSQPG